MCLQFIWEGVPKVLLKRGAMRRGGEEAGSLHVPMWNLSGNSGGQYEVWGHQAFSHQLPRAVGWGHH